MEEFVFFFLLQSPVSMTIENWSKMTKDEYRSFEGMAWLSRAAVLPVPHWGSDSDLHLCPQDQALSSYDRESLPRYFLLKNKMSFWADQKRRKSNTQLQSWREAHSSGPGGSVSSCCLFWEMYCMLCMAFLGWRALMCKCVHTAVSEMWLFSLFTVTQGKSMHLETRVVFFRCSSYIFTSPVQLSISSSNWSWACENKKMSRIILNHLPRTWTECKTVEDQCNF